MQKAGRRRCSSGSGPDAWRAPGEQGLPAYVIFRYAALREIATPRPADLAALGPIGGIGRTSWPSMGRAWWSC